MSDVTDRIAELKRQRNAINDELASLQNANYIGTKLGMAPIGHMYAVNYTLPGITGPMNDILFKVGPSSWKTTYSTALQSSQNVLTYFDPATIIWQEHVGSVSEGFPL